MKELVKNVYVWNGTGYYLSKLNCRDKEDGTISINEVAYRCLLNEVGYLLPCDTLSQEEYEELENDDRFVYCDISEVVDGTWHKPVTYFLCIENMQAENIEIVG